MHRTHANWKPPFSSWPSWPCPTCNVGTLINKNVTTAHSAGTVKLLSGDEWEPDWLEEHFSAKFECNNKNCKESFFCCGHASPRETEVETYDGNYELVYSNIFIPLFFHPTLHIFSIPKECPEKISHEILRSFSVFWSDIKCALNCIRSAVEFLLDDKKIPKLSMSKNKKRIKISLHDRIVKFKTKNPEGATYLEAIKWLGNSGSHAQAISPNLDDIFKAYDLIEQAIQHIYVKRTENIKRLATKVTARKGRPLRTPS